MCLLTACADRVDVDLFWLGEAILVFPDGPTGRRDAEVQLNGLARPAAGGGTLVFAHRGQIYDLRDRTGEWLDESDWYTDKVMRNPSLPNKSVSRAGADKVSIRCRQEMPPIHAQVFQTGEGTLRDARVFCSDGRHDYPSAEAPPDLKGERPIFTSFRMYLKQDVLQLFRLSFRTSFGVADYGSQVDLTIEGPNLAIDSIRQDIARHVVAGNLKEDLRREIDRISDSMLEPPYDIAVIPHPGVTLTIDGIVNAELPITAPVESQGTPLRSAACPSRAMFFEMKRRDFLVKAVAQITSRRMSYSQEFNDALRNLGFDDKQS